MQRNIKNYLSKTKWRMNEEKCVQKCRRAKKMKKKTYKLVMHPQFADSANNRWMSQEAKRSQSQMHWTLTALFMHRREQCKSARKLIIDDTLLAIWWNYETKAASNANSYTRWRYNDWKFLLLTLFYNFHINNNLSICHKLRLIFLFFQTF